MFEIKQHVADVRLFVQGATREEMYADAMRGMFAIMRGSVGSAQIIRHRIEVDSVDRTALLVDLLSDILTRSHVNREMYDHAQFETLTDTQAVVNVVGYSPANFEQDVKAVTYHEADVRYENGMWSTTLVFDI
jgi:SHS2 domain-containing protein